ncbi:MAG: hypothetical protein D6776_01035, partial [Planctomycetota bacterium]
MRRSVRLAVGISGLVLLVLAAPALAGWLRLRLAARSLRIEAQEQLADRNYPAAARTLERLVREQPDSAEAVGALLLLGKARAATGDLPGAIDAWDELVRRFPEHDLASKARFLIADTLARQGKLREAALRTAERARHFTGDAYRASIAALYLEIADEAYIGTPRGKKGDPLDPARRERHFDRALAMYTRAERVGVAPERRAEVSYRIADCYRQLGRLEAAERAYRRYLERFPDDTLRNRARLELGLVLLDLGRSAEARKQLEQLVQIAGNDEVVPLALRALGRSWKPLEGADPARVDRAARYWRTLLERFPDHEQAPEVAFDLARALEAVGRTDEAVQQYLALEKRYPDHPRAPEARWRAGLCLRRAGRFDEARTVWARFLSQYPLHERFVEVQRAIERLAFDRAERLYAEQRYEQAEAAWRAFVEAQPASELAPQAALRVGESLLRRKAYDAAREALSACASRYRDSPVAPKAQWLLVETLEHTGALREQITALRTLIERWPASPEADRARRRLARLEETELELRSEQVCHAGESFTVRAITRNVEALELRAYPIDLLAYFRKKHTLQGVESLALDVAAPARRWRVETPDYEPYRRFDQRLPLPLEGKGGWVVMAEQTLYRATVLAIRSDLSIICKQAPRQLLVFARDERTGRPWPGVRVLVSDGRAIVAQGVSGDDGVFTTTFDRPRGALRVFAHAGHDVAYSDAEPASASASTGYGTKGLVYTDRPLYRPGDRVRMRAIVRTASAGSYQPTGDKPVELLLRAPNGTVFWRRTLRTSRFGTVAAETWLPEAAPLGRWSVVCRFAGLEFPASIHVEAYVKPELEVRLRPDRDDHVAGEPVQLTVEARAFAGGPAAHATVHYVVWRRDYRFDPERYRRFAWWFGRSRKGAGEQSAPPADLVAEGTARTDAQGRATIRFDTDTEAGDSVYTVLAEVQGPSGRASTGSRNVHVTRSAYFAVCTTDRRVYRPGDRVRLELFTVRADHTGVARRGELLWQRRDDGQWITTSREPVTTGDDGRATIELEAPAPGSWRLRFEGRDRAGTLVAASVDLEVAGERKQAAHEAKLVFERAVYRRGDRARALVRSPVAPVWALLTFEADRVIGHRVIELRRTSTTIELPMQDRFSPNVFVRIAIPGSHQLFEAGDEIAVVKFLQLHVEASAERVAPGGELTLRFKATDQAGRPVQAELGLAIVDEAIFSLRPDPTPRLAPWFYDQRRSLAVRTRSSYAWSYRGERRERPPALLAELERRQWEQEQARRRAEQQRRFGERLVRSREAGPPPAAPPAGKAQAEEAEAFEGAFDRAAGGFGRLRAAERKARARPSPRNAAAPR